MNGHFTYPSRAISAVVELLVIYTITVIIIITIIIITYPALLVGRISLTATQHHQQQPAPETRGLELSRCCSLHVPYHQQSSAYNQHIKLGAINSLQQHNYNVSVQTAGQTSAQMMQLSKSINKVQMQYKSWYASSVVCGYQPPVTELFWLLQPVSGTVYHSMSHPRSHCQSSAVALIHISSSAASRDYVVVPEK